MAEIAVGIDLGTSNSCVAIARDGQVEVLPNAYGESITASVVAFADDGTITVGNAARANVIHDPVNTVCSSKRLLGRYFFSEEVKKARAICSYEIVEGPSHSARIRVRGQDYALPEVSAMILREMKAVAEARLGVAVTKAVVTVPAYFNDNQRQATKDAGRIAGLEVLRILNEPTAAALAYGFGRGLSQRVAIYDLGGGTFDISILEIGQDVFEVLSTCGDTFLGGDDFDDRLIDLLADEFRLKEGINLRADPFALEKLKVAAESAKRALSVDDEVEIRIPDVLVGPDGTSRSLHRVLTTQEYGQIVMDLVVRTFKVCDEALQQASLSTRDLAGVILVGGPTRLPLIRQAVRDYFQQEPRSDVNPDEVVALGAAIHAASLVQAESKAFLLDVTPLSLRVGVAGGLAEPIIDRNTPVPIEQTRTFTTFQDGQESVNIRVYQGESRQATDNALLGQFEFAGFRKARRGEVRIAVTFSIDGDGIVQVTARDVESGQEASTRITLSSGLSEQDMQEILSRDSMPGIATPAPHASTMPETSSAIPTTAHEVVLDVPPIPAPLAAIAAAPIDLAASAVASVLASPAATTHAAAQPSPVPMREEAVLLPDDDLDVLPDELPELGLSELPGGDAEDPQPVIVHAADAAGSVADDAPDTESVQIDHDEDDHGALELTAGLVAPPAQACGTDPEAIDIGDIFGDPDDALPLEPALDPFDHGHGDLAADPSDENSGLDLEIDIES